MTPSGAPIVTAAQMRTAEETLFRSGVSQDALMERAGQAVAAQAARFAMGRPILILAGPGNNGGDAYVAARHLRDAREAFDDDARAVLEKQKNVRLLVVDTPPAGGLATREISGGMLLQDVDVIDAAGDDTASWTPNANALILAAVTVARTGTPAPTTRRWMSMSSTAGSTSQ